ncbi:MAG TPA: zinc-ribbon domain-containing protein [Holophagaceae bacterium]|jgi:predicted Zn finger-like uncharacterized protein|nr:zinc-ribbon domain-containing protein [Holophagaceae bacterium]
MVEAIQCPSCQTRYGLRQARVRSGLRRAQCFRCGDVFQIEPEVKRLLGLLEPAATSSVPLDVLAEAIHQAPEHHGASAPMPALEAHDLTLGDLEIPEPELEEAPAAALPAPSETAPILSMARMPELPMAEAAPAAAVMADYELPPLPEPAAASQAAPEEASAPSGSYASARDAIARLFGDTPLAPSPTANLRNALDMDAGMKALEDTLGGVKADALSTKPLAAAAQAPEPGAVPMAETELPHASATLRLTAAEVASATGSVMSSGSTLSKASEPPEISQEEVTMVLPPPPAPASTLDAADPSALRLRIGDQTYAGLDLPTIAKWIEEGRVLEDHQVARGVSENWMDAVKVPALRPVFERLRRARAGITDVLPPPPMGIADTGPKRGLFGGMFGK